MNNYFPIQYKEDLAVQKELKKDCICRRVIDEFLKAEEPLLIDLKQFYLFNFYLNLFDEVISEHFPEHHQVWQEHSLPFIYYKCTNERYILSWARFLVRKKYKGVSLRVTGKDYIESNVIFLDYANSILAEDIFKGLEIEAIQEAVAADDKYHDVISSIINKPTWMKRMKLKR